MLRDDPAGPLTGINRRVGATGLEGFRQAIELRAIEDAGQMAIGEAHDAAALELGGRAADGFERQAEVAGDVRAAHWQLDVPSIVTIAGVHSSC